MYGINDIISSPVIGIREQIKELMNTKPVFLDVELDRILEKFWKIAQEEKLFSDN